MIDCEKFKTAYRNRSGNGGKATASGLVTSADVYENGDDVLTFPRGKRDLSRNPLSLKKAAGYLLDGKKHTLRFAHAARIVIQFTVDPS